MCSLEKEWNHESFLFRFLCLFMWNWSLTYNIIKINSNFQINKSDVVRRRLVFFSSIPIHETAKKEFSEFISCPRKTFLIINNPSVIFLVVVQCKRISVFHFFRNISSYFSCILVTGENCPTSLIAFFVFGEMRLFVSFTQHDVGFFLLFILLSIVVTKIAQQFFISLQKF